MKYDRVHNFYAGPAVLPVSVVEALAAQLPNLDGSGIGLMEISHRSKAFDAVFQSAKAGLARILGIPEGYDVLFLQGGASLQFLMVPMNLMGKSGKADYLDSGAWAKKAIKECKFVGDTKVVWSGAEGGYADLPAVGGYEVRPDSAYLHYTTNETIGGVQWKRTPESGDVLLVADASSDIASRPIDVARHAAIYAGAQKNMGPSGVTIVIVRKDLLGKTGDAIPTYLNYQTHIDNEGLFNTPSTLGIYVVDQVCKWIEGLGGLAAVEAINEEKGGMLYTELDRTSFWKPHAARDVRSMMNVTWRIANNDLEPKFISEATKAGLIGLKGHRSVGGLRASLYNACPLESVKVLVDFMREFERVNG
ncbi:MAG: 3-phosphoserine/phosphohydroxythreonine transaminase [Pseudomonadota bacterium]